jgi:hypothetical protein
MLALINAQGVVQGICTGMLVRPDVVLTAQHCVADVNQVPYQPTQLVYTLDANPIQAQGILNISSPAARRVSSIVQWAERTTPPSIFRDVALVKLSNPFNENFPIFDIRQTSIDSQAGITDLIMSGYGGYTNGANANTYSVGQRLYGAATFSGYSEAPFPEFNNPNYVGTGDYLRIVPGAQGQIICGGDSGSSLFWDGGSMRSIVGVTSLGLSQAATAGQQCATTSEGLFVPAHQIRGWVSTKLGEIKMGDKLESYTVLQATIKAATPVATGQSLVLSDIKLLDDGLRLGTNELTANVCEKDCPNLTEITGELKAGQRMTLRLVKSGEVLNVTQVRPLTVPAVYPVEFDATVAELAGTEIEVYGRKEQRVVFSNVKLANGSSALPLMGGKGVGVLCSAGCSVSSSIKTVGFQPLAEKGVTIKAEVIEGQGVYVREIAANPAMDAEALAPKPPVVVVDEEEPKPAKKKKKKSKC